jgi:hypothetical protein
VRFREFAELMNAFSVPQGRLIAESFDFTRIAASWMSPEDLGPVVEIGVKHPHMRGIVMDLELVCAIAREQVWRRGCPIASRPLPRTCSRGRIQPGRRHPLGHILHDWSDDTCRRILRHCAAALPGGGVLLISESVLGENFVESGRQRQGPAHARRQRTRRA